MARVLDCAELARGDNADEFEGYLHDATVSIIVVDAPPGGGPKLHRHPYEEVFVIHEGAATFTVGDDVIEAAAVQIVVAPASVPHKFVNAGAGRLRQTDIHASDRFITEWLED
jgi:mannose-6-phosphate isomerase-like protein (cupin superfamily)